MTGAPDFAIAIKDRLAAGIGEVLALRSLWRYRGTRASAEIRGADVSTLPSAPAMPELVDLYERKAGDWLGESVNSAAGALSLIEFAATIIADQMTEEVLGGSPASRETDLGHVLRALIGISHWANKAEFAEIKDRRGQQGADADHR